MRSELLVFGAPQIEQAEIDEVLVTMRSGWLGTGPKVTQFEGDFAGYKGVDSSLVAALSSCTAALHLSLRAANLAPGDEVITTALTFCATVNAIIHAGATPVLADVDVHSMNIDPDSIEACITPKTRAILPVHFAGRACDMDAIMEIAERHKLLVIEDCAHAIETEFKGRKAGTIGDFGCFSFYVTKNVVTGEGGMNIAHDPEHIKRIKSLALHGLSQDAWKRFSDVGYKHYQVEDCGFKYNMMDLQAAIGIHQLARVDKNWNRRKAIWDHYQQAFSKLPIYRPPEPPADTRHAYHLYTLLVNEEATGMGRDAFLDAMTQQNIGVGVHYLSIPEHPYYQRTFGWRAKDYPNATRIGQQTVSLPLSAKLTDTDVEDVIRAVQRICG
ncbi:MAG: DegT/DnrJ/EryC1/StrS family aminotransferase [Gammaproteobacteria bacterium]|nr:DegT/DnrJ/EryC1/StrS family aminotransferase [Gammaproteobacteria bacterium]